MHCLAVAGLAAALAAIPVVAAGQDAPVRTPPDLSRFLSFESQMEPAELDQAVREASAHPLGSMENPIRAEGPPGQRAYLERLRCGDGTAPAFKRQGSGGPSPFGGVIDYYAVQCQEQMIQSLVMDMYHPGYRERRPVPGFTIRPAE